MLQTLSQSIPERSTRVRAWFDHATVGDSKWRRTSAITAAALSALNVPLYIVDLLLIKPLACAGRCILFFVDLGSTDFDSSARGISKSLYFAAFMTGRVVRSWFGKEEWFKVSFSESILESTLSKGFEKLDTKEYTVQDGNDTFSLLVSKDIPIYINTDTGNDLTKEGLFRFLEEHPTLVMVRTPGKKNYLVKRELPLIASLVRDRYATPYTPPTAPAVCRVEKREQKAPILEESREDNGVNSLSAARVIQPSPETQSSVLAMSQRPAPDLAASLVSYGMEKKFESSLTKSFLFVDSILPESDIQPESKSWIDILGGFWKAYVTGEDHPIKLKKYEVLMKQTWDLIQSAEMDGLLQIIEKQAFTPLKEKCMQLDFILKNPGKYGNEREQYKAFVQELQRHVEPVDGKDDACKAWLGKLCYHRFAEAKLYNYCQDLVESVAGELPKDLSLASFWAVLEKKNEEIEKKSEEAAGIPASVRAAQKMQGHFNVFFNPLLGKNVPYVYGHMEGKTITRHGVPVKQSNPLGLGTLAGWVGGSWGSPIVTADYHDFIREAGENEKNILHFIFENGETKSTGGDESARVKARLALGDKHDNFFPVALRMDGDFFKGTQHVVNKNWQAPQRMAFKQELCENLLKPNTGFCFPEKVRKVMRDKEKTVTEYMEKIINSVEAIYFSAPATEISSEKYQAFILLTYAHLMHKLGNDLNISILEGFCKDDKDRGGAFKAILALDFLYRSNQLTPEKLQEVMIGLLAPPLMITKDAILPSRSSLIKHVLDVMQKAPSYSDLDTQYRLKGEFNIAREPYQVVMPGLPKATTGMPQ